MKNIQKMEYCITDSEKWMAEYKHAETDNVDQHPTQSQFAESVFRQKKKRNYFLHLVIQVLTTAAVTRPRASKLV